MNLTPTFRDELVKRSISRAQDIYDGFNRFCESPIETSFATAFYLSAEQYGEIVTGPPGGRGLFCIQSQVHVLSYRADFVICENIENPSMIVVECDGHEYHERTKEQAERDRRRDREMQSAGYRVFRFTGREIYRNAFKCAEEVLREAIITGGRGRL